MRIREPVSAPESAPVPVDPVLTPGPDLDVVEPVPTPPPAPLAANPLHKQTLCIWTGEAHGDVEDGQLVAVTPLAAEKLRDEGRARYATPEEARDRASAVPLADI